ncbi:profilin, required for normal timing of actin polymerization in response to thermal stress [Puttea exsequens]|nr:profilin, required for normal timing of actin polymerization in response to thermal stress [Puttea exsequens]
MSWQGQSSPYFCSLILSDFEDQHMLIQASWEPVTLTRLQSSIAKEPVFGPIQPALQYVDLVPPFDATSPSIQDSIWAVKPEEIKEVIASYKDGGDVKKIQSNGFHIAGKKYMTIKADEKSVYGKQGKEGVCIVKTQQAVLVAHYPESVQPGSAANTVEQLGDYLIGVGY